MRKFVSVKDMAERVADDGKDGEMLTTRRNTTMMMNAVRWSISRYKTAAAGNQLKNLLFP